MDYNDAENFEKNLKAAVQEHFQNEYKIDSKRVIDALLKLKKDDKVDLELIKTYSSEYLNDANFICNRKPVRNKPKIMTSGF